MPLVLAHSGHWLVSLLYLAPVVALVIILSIQVWRDRRRPPDGDAVGVEDSE